MTSTDEARRLRAKPRLKLFQPTEMRLGEVTTRAHLLDLSTAGALVHAAVPPAHGGDVQVRVAGALRQARVMWVDDRRFGVVFHLPLTDAQVADALAPAPDAK